MSTKKPSRTPQPRTPQINLRGPSRRDFIKYSVALGAALGLGRTKVFNVLGDLGGVALADEAACAPTNRSVHIIGGSAGFAWFELLWPQIDIALANNPAFAFHDPKNATMAAGTDRPLILGPQAPWRSLAPGRQLSVFMAGHNEFTGAHTDAPTNSSVIDPNGNKGLFAACAALQQANPTLVPVIGVRAGGKTSMPYAAFPGTPPAADVATADSMLGLFDSAAASAMGPLSSPQNAAYFEAYYKGFLGLSAAANKTTYARALGTGKTASRLVGVNLSGQLKPTAQDLANYGLSLSTSTTLMEFGRSLIITAKAFKLGLTSCVMLPAFNDDPHGAFADMTVLLKTVTTLGKILDAFLKDLAVPDATCAGATIADNLVVSIHTDTPKNPLIKANWPDDTPRNANWIFALGAGWLRTGWYGGIKADASVDIFDPSNGATVKNINFDLKMTSPTTLPVAGAVAYAVAKGDMRRVGDFYRGPDFSGIVQQKIM